MSSGEQKFVTIKPGRRIAFDCQGSGPGLMLLHGGFVQDRSVWREHGYVAALQDRFTVVSMDILGHGASSKPVDPRAYAIDGLLDDLHRVAAAAGLERYFVWGFSLGASIALHAAARGRLLGVVAVGSYFGQGLLDYSRQNIEPLQQTLAAQRSAQLDLNALSPEEQFFVGHADLELSLTVSTAMADWPSVEPEQVQTPTLVGAGTEDPIVYSALQQDVERIRGAGLKLHFFSGLDHFQTLTEREAILPVVRAFLDDHRGAAPAQQ